jgi:glycosyltransferase involved in cell wall biosynthesis
LFYNFSPNLSAISQVLVVDSLSSDKTCEIAERLGAKIIKQEYLGLRKMGRLWQL